MSISAPAISTRLTAEKIANLREKVERLNLTESRERYEDNLSEFVRGAWSSIDSSAYQESWVVGAMCDHLECVTTGHISRLLINVPPRCSKTSIVSILYPAWVWARSQISFWSGPQVKFLCASYDHGLALESSNKSRRLMCSPWFQKHWPNKIEFLSDQNLKTNFGNTVGGARISTSVASQILGRGGDILIADDLNKVRNDEVETADERNAVKDFWNEFSSTRLNDPKRGAIIGVQQRLHQSDMSGLILDGDEDWVHLCIPMEYDSSRHCVTVRLPQYDDDRPWEDPRAELAEQDGHDGQLMWPERFGPKEVQALKTKLGPFMAAGRLQQMPTPKGGGILKRDWWGYWSQSESSKYSLKWNPNLREFPPFELVIGSIDTAYKEREQNDYNALTVWGIWNDLNKNRKAMLMFSWARRLPLHGREVEPKIGEGKLQFQQRREAEWGLVEHIAATCKKYKVRRLLIEDKSRGVDVANEINRLYARENWGVELVNPVGDKVSRAHSVVPMFTDGMIWAPAGPNSNGFFTKWAEDVVHQCELFPKADHDDLVDSVTQFLIWARENEILIRADEMSAILEDEMAYHPKIQSVAEIYGV
jgi:predicted phage terminase large subunit-like protein